MTQIQTINISAGQIMGLNIEALEPIWVLPVKELLQLESKLQLQMEWPRPENDPRELSEIAECRLWSLRADALCPWLPLLLERENGQLSRHVAMLVPHSFNKTEGIRFSEDALSLWVSHRLFHLDHWSQMQGYQIKNNLNQMVAALGFELDPSFWPKDMP